MVTLWQVAHTVRFTLEYGCKILVYVERIEDIKEAITREKAIKAWKRRWKTELISRTNPDWRDLYDHINA
jgi:putative endonuclease